MKKNLARHLSSIYKYLRRKLFPRFDEFRNWELRKYSAPSPHFIKQACIIRNGILGATWVETGTFLGDTTKKLSKIASSVYSIEPSPELFARAKNSLAHLKNVHLLNGLSENVFPLIIPTLHGDICFWLDGHFSGGETYLGPLETPILEELKYISLNLSRFNRIVVMVDDIRCFNPNIPMYSGYPNLEYLVTWAKNNNLTWSIEQDIFIAKNFHA